MNRPAAHDAKRDRGAVDISIEMLFGAVCMLLVMLTLFEASAYWHARNVFDDAAADGVRVAAAFDGTCSEGVETALASVARQAGSWASDVAVECIDGPMVTITVSGRTPGVLGGSTGFEARAVESTPRER